MRKTLIEALTWALKLKPDPATMKVSAVVLLAAFFGLLLFAVVQSQTSERRWGMKLVIGLACGATFVGLGADVHWLLGALYGVGYLLTWLAWVLTRRWCWWRRALARGVVAALTLGPWLWLGATEKERPTWANQSGLAEWLLAPTGLIWFWMMLGALWLLVLVGGWGYWGWPLTRPGRRRWIVVIWVVLGVLGLNWYAAGRVALLAASGKGQSWRLGYVLVSRPGAQWYRHVDGQTPLHCAARNDAEAVRLLLAAGAEVNAKTDGRKTPLHMAAENGNAKGIRLLLAAGAAVNAKENNGTTPLHRAALRGNAEAIRLLLAAGAAVNDKGEYGLTPLNWAGTNECHELLRTAGGKSGAELDAAPPVP